MKEGENKRAWEGEGRRVREREGRQGGRRKKMTDELLPVTFSIHFFPLSMDFFHLNKGQSALNEEINTITWSTQLFWHDF